MPEDAALGALLCALVIGLPVGTLVGAVFLRADDPEPVPLQSVGCLRSVLIKGWHLASSGSSRGSIRAGGCSGLPLFFRRAFSKVSRLEEPGVFAPAGGALAVGEANQTASFGVVQLAALCQKLGRHVPRDSR